MLEDYIVHLVKIVCFLDGWLVNEVIYFIYFNLFRVFLERKRYQQFTCQFEMI